jgi:hypothetical protein
MFTVIFCKRLLTDAREVVVVQQQFLDLMIRAENGAVPMDATTRADLIDLMARVLVVVFHEEGGRVDDRDLVQSQNQAGAPGSQSDRLPTAVYRQTGTAE